MAQVTQVAQVALVPTTIFTKISSIIPKSSVDPQTFKTESVAVLTGMLNNQPDFVLKDPILNPQRLALLNKPSDDAFDVSHWIPEVSEFLGVHCTLCCGGYTNPAELAHRLSQELHFALKFETVVTGIDMFGPKKNIPVVKISGTSEMTSITKGSGCLEEWMANDVVTKHFGLTLDQYVEQIDGGCKSFKELVTKNPSNAHDLMRELAVKTECKQEYHLNLRKVELQKLFEVMVEGVVFKGVFCKQYPGNHPAFEVKC